MQFFHQAPLVRLVIPFVLGIVFAIFYPAITSTNVLLTINVFILFSSYAIYRFKRLNSYANRWLFGLFISIFLVVLGYQLCLLNVSTHKSSHFSKIASGNSVFIAQIYSPLQEKVKTYKTIANVIAVKKDNIWIQTTGKIQLQLIKDTSSPKLKYGDVILVNASIKEVEPPKNPNEFNYKRYLSFHQLYHQAFLSSANWVFTNSNEANIVFSIAYAFRDKLLSILKQVFSSKDEYAVASALLVGYEEDLSKEIISAYSTTGALHVLSVSGLHVGIIYYIINGILFFLEKFKRGFIVKTLLLLLFIWAYALLTGLSPSVLRASVMFSFIIIGKSMGKYVNMYNILAASCFFLLLINPFLITEVGFQLSYLAVIGIVMLYSPIYNRIETRYWLVDKIWSITAVSLAAQFATFPLGLLYFHQFPNYFIISNLLIIPISTFVLLLGIILILFYPVSSVFIVLGKFLNNVTYFLNYLAKVFQDLPFALINAIHISIMETFIIYVILILLIAFLFFKKVKFLYAFLVSIIVFLGIQLVELYNQSFQKSIIVYSVPKTTVIDFICGQEHILLVDSIAYETKKDEILYHLKNNWYYHALYEPKIVYSNKNFSTDFFVKKDNKMQFLDKKILLLSNTFSGKVNEKIDFLILDDNKADINDLIYNLQFQQLIVTSKVSKKTRSILEKNVAYYSVYSSGAYSVNL